MLYFSILFFFFNDTATTEIYTLSLHDALPISHRAQLAVPAPGHRGEVPCLRWWSWARGRRGRRRPSSCGRGSEEHQAEIPSHQYIVCRHLLRKKKRTITITCAEKASPCGVMDA